MRAARCIIVILHDNPRPGKTHLRMSANSYISSQSIAKLAVQRDRRAAADPAMASEHDSFAAHLCRSRRNTGQLANAPLDSLCAFCVDRLQNELNRKTDREGTWYPGGD